MFKFILPLLITLTIAHPHYYLDIKQNCDNTTKVLSWHIHIVFSLTRRETYEKAMELRDRAREYFKDHLGPDCNQLFDAGRLCFIVDHKFDTVLRGGPFPSGEWSMFVPVSHLSLVIPWFSINRGEFSFLVHPNTGCMYEDIQFGLSGLVSLGH